MARDPLIGTTLNGYTLLEAVGEGGTAAVYRATHPTHGNVALKVLREKLRNDKNAIARFVREASYGLQISHPNAVRTLELGEGPGGLHFLALEWADGELLEKYAKRLGSLPPDEVAVILTQVAAAVASIHARGIVHRDLKPDNTMYNPATRQAKLLDYGIAVSTDTAPDERLTRAGFFVGTLMYVAPEALSGDLPGPAADQYSLGSIAYYLLSGVLPYGAKSAREMFSLLLSQPPTPLNQAKPGLKFHSEVERVIMKALSRQPADRYPDVETFARELSAALALPPETAGSEGGLFSKIRGVFGGKK
ncbi:MAG: serine/threonine-protein kinase [Gemmatimonadaceae bacterium]|nr:serine/threonine-protein kinase [Gemmatimonadaceae bacterium]